MKQHYSADDIQTMFPQLTRSEALTVVQNLPTPILDKLLAKIVAYEQVVDDLNAQILLTSHALETLEAQ